jgi:hypothetical protein
MAGEKQEGEVYLMRVILDSLKIKPPKGPELVMRFEVPMKELEAEVATRSLCKPP